MDSVAPATQTLRQIVYVSHAIRPMPEDELAVLLARSRERDAALGITGMLLYRGGNFIQTIEGPEDSVEALLSALRRDTRHDGMIVILDLPATGREFGDWAMAFRRITDQDNDAILDEVTMRGGAVGSHIAGGGAARKLLQLFHQNLR